MYLLFTYRDVKNLFGTNGIIKKAFTATAIQGNMVILNYNIIVFVFN